MRWFRVVLWCAVGLLASRAVGAHPMSISGLDIVIDQNGHLHGELAVDSPPAPQRDDRRARFERDTFDGLTFRADGEPVAFEIGPITWGSSDLQGAAATDRTSLQAELPPDSKTFTVQTTRRFGGLDLSIQSFAHDQPTRFSAPAGYESLPYHWRGPEAVIGHPAGEAIELGPRLFFSRKRGEARDLTSPRPSAASSSQTPAPARSGPIPTSAPTEGETKPAPPGAFTHFALYAWIGVEHIVPDGLDHMLFVLGLFLLGTTFRSLLALLTAFTVAHSLTLACAVFGWVDVPARVVESAIAASIAVVGVENFLAARRRRGAVPSPSFTSRHPAVTLSMQVGVVLAFGLLHGLGFAGALADLGLPEDSMMSALVGFNAGVELGQLGVVALTALVTWPLRRPTEIDSDRLPPLPVWLQAAGGLLIALVGTFWGVERFAGL